MPSRKPGLVRVYPHAYVFMDTVPAVEQEVSPEVADMLVASGAFTREPPARYPPPAIAGQQPQGAPEGAPSDPTEV
jgi:hypothetical protein